MQAIRITIKYDTGQLDVANGNNAAEIMAWWNSCETLAIQRGAQYAGPGLKRIDCLTQADEMPSQGVRCPAARGAEN